MAKKPKPIIDRMQDSEGAVIEQRESHDGSRFVHYTGPRVITKEDLMERCGLNPVEWEVLSVKPRSWETPMKLKVDGNEVCVAVTNFYIALSLRPLLVPNTEAFIDRLQRQLSKMAPPTYPMEVPRLPGDGGELMLEVMLADAHLGSLAWRGETGENYDLRIAEKRYLAAMQDLIGRVQSRSGNVGKVLYVVGNDYFNVDSLENTTTAGTPQSEDSRWPKTWEVGCECMIKTIDMALAVGPVEVLVVPGNHDTQRTRYMGTVLQHHYNTTQDVTIDNTSAPRKYTTWGSNLLGFTHGNNELVSDLIHLMADEARVAFGKAKNCEFHIGHIHQEKKMIPVVQTKGRVAVRVFPSLAGINAWHKGRGYRSPQGARGLLWHKANGLMEVLHHYPSV